MTLQSLKVATLFNFPCAGIIVGFGAYPIFEVIFNTHCSNFGTWFCYSAMFA